MTDHVGIVGGGIVGRAQRTLPAATSALAIADHIVGRLALTA